MLEPPTTGQVITNGSRFVRCARDGAFDPCDVPSPIVIAGPGRAVIQNLRLRMTVSTNIDTSQSDMSWHTTYRGDDGRLFYDFAVTWKGDTDTLLIDEQVHFDTDAVVVIHPLGSQPATACAYGVAKNNDPMKPLAKPELSNIVGRLGHLSYFNQWQLSWVGFADQGEAAPFIGLFTGWAHDWRGRGNMRIDVVRTEAHGDLLHLPLRRGRRRWGLVLSDRAGAGVDDVKNHCLLHQRKVAFSDLPPDKTARWQLDAPLPDRRFRLISPYALTSLHDRIPGDSLAAAAMDDYHAHAGPSDPGYLAAAIWKSDDVKAASAVEELLVWARQTDATSCAGGYESLSIFHGRSVKRRAYDLDAMWALGLIDDAGYREVRRSMLRLAYMFRDEDFCRYADFWPDAEADDDPSAAAAIDRDMGPTPVPPNFAAEFASSVGVIAAIFDDHPESAGWLAWAARMIDGYLDRFFEADGTYREAVNYHNHTLNMLCCVMWPMRLRGLRNFFDDPRVVGSFDHFLTVATPPTDAVEPTDGRFIRHPGGSIMTVLADPRVPRRAYINNGNSGDNWLMHSPRGELPVGIAAYRETDPRRAGHLAWLWRQVGMPLMDSEHPLLTLALLDHSVDPIEPARHSTHRDSLGIVSHSTAHGETFSLFRAGSATNHMDFDQGAIQLIAHGKPLLRDPGYHAHIPGHPAATRFHSTLIYSDNLDLSSGYTGLERAPKPLRATLNDGYDWCVHRIVNTNHRDLSRLAYNVVLPCETTTHWRHYLFAKVGGYVVIHDAIDPANRACVYLLQPPGVLEQAGPTTFTADAGDDVHLDVQFFAPQQLKVDRRQAAPPCWTFALRGDGTGRFTALLAPRRGKQRITATCDGSIIHVEHAYGRDQIQLPDAPDGEIAFVSDATQRA